MTLTVEAIYDGKVLRPEEPLSLAPNTRVQLTVTVENARTNGAPASFLDLAKTVQLDGPEDWSANLDNYLYGNDLNAPS